MFPARPDPSVLQQASAATQWHSGTTLSEDESLEPTPRSAEVSPKVVEKNGVAERRAETSPTRQPREAAPIPEPADEGDVKSDNKAMSKEHQEAESSKETEVGADNWLDYVVDAARGRIKRKPGQSTSDQAGSSLDLGKGGLVKVAKVAKRNDVTTPGVDGGQLWRERLKRRQQMLSEKDLVQPLPTRQQRMAGSDEISRK
ncbi:hypothetical protein BOVATA_005650 [Babesia ovata]|uniref:Uncharacterized protein n=1 Tax=Babesia ovata TaxID=189622 RepID=A0A2H6K7U2_9APIC|nr:uncharacterized protein BOVATA_005650 [Babesia ovata]GBE59072.1 hypothetical protein BOVATA_005650 [Babesia ovata]